MELIELIACPIAAFLLLAMIYKPKNKKNESI